MERHSNSSHVTQPHEHVTCLTAEASAAVAASSASYGAGNGAKYKLMSPAKLPISRSPCITIPPGLSPSSFLESPVLLSNIKAEPSPTTGSFFKPRVVQGLSHTDAFSSAPRNPSNHDSDAENSSSFEFQFHPGPASASGLSIGPVSSAGMKQLESDSLRQVQDQSHSQSVAPTTLIKLEVPTSAESGQPASVSKHGPVVGNTAATESGEITERYQQNSCIQGAHTDCRDMTSSLAAERSPDDGYNWRKYGQKLVKGSEFPRSYYKCTYPNCEVKKVFERSPDGQITEIVYKGSHDHPKPQPSRRFTPAAVFPIQEEKVDKDSTFIGQEGKFNTNGQTTNTDVNGINDLSPQLTADDGQDYALAPFQSSNDDVEEEDPFSKRRKMDGSVDITPIVKPIREPRVVVQTVSEVDILDDGYRWRKYGQKVVRGNPNPRSYYKCTNAGCPVRKHVERASHDPKAVITTYEGKHNHDVPTARTSSHELAGPTSIGGISRIRSEESDSVSLDLGVGMTYGTQNRTNGQIHAPEAEACQSQISIPNSGTMAVQTSARPGYYGIVNGGMTLYGSRENHADSRGYEMPPLHPSNQCPQNLGQILMGP